MDLVGHRITTPTHNQIYLVNPEGYLQWIPGADTYNNLFVDWNGVIAMDTSTLPIGDSLSYGAILARTDTSTRIYIISNAQKRWITTPTVMDKYYFNWNNVYVFPQVSLRYIPTGPNWS